MSEPSDLRRLHDALSESIHAGDRLPPPKNLGCPLCGAQPLMIDAVSSRFRSLQGQHDFVRTTFRCACGANVKVEVQLQLSEDRRCAHAFPYEPGPPVPVRSYEPGRSGYEPEPDA